MNRRGFALGLALVFTIAIGALATSAIILSSNATMMAKASDRQRDVTYAAEAALEIAKSRVALNAALVPDTGERQIITNQTITEADGTTLPGVTVNAWVGPSGATSGESGNFISIVAQAIGPRNATFVRRLEMSDESFAKYAYWSNVETLLGATNSFSGGESWWGPVWSNDVIHIGSGGATFHDVVGTAQTISNANKATFLKSYTENGSSIALPTAASLSSLSGYASAAGYSFTPPTSGDESSVLMRVEFVSTDLDADGDSTDDNEGFFRVYQANTGQQSWLRGDWPGTSTVTDYTNCGDWHDVPGSKDQKFFPAAVHPTSWFRQLVQSGGLKRFQARAESSATIATIMQHSGARCYLGGDPHLVAVERTAALYPNASDREKGGDDTTFTPVGAYGAWKLYSSTPNAAVSAVRGDAKYLFPLYRGYNSSYKGVLYFNGTVGVSGTVGGAATLYARGGDIVLLDDLRYANDPSLATCADMLGLIADNDIVVADNSLNTPENVSAYWWSTKYQSLDDTQDMYVQGVLMALNTSFRVQNYNSGPRNALTCQGDAIGRGCLYLTGGIIENNPGPVGTNYGYGFDKEYGYDACGATNPPPFFPSTGHFVANRYFEVDPVGFNITSLFAAITR